MILFRLQVAENTDHWPFNTPAGQARLAASGTLGFVAGGESNHSVRAEGGEKKKRHKEIDKKDKRENV